MGGYSMRGNNLFGINLNSYSNVSDVNLTYTSLLYGNGPGNLRSVRTYNLTNELTGILNSLFEKCFYNSNFQIFI